MRQSGEANNHCDTLGTMDTEPLTDDGRPAVYKATGTNTPTALEGG